MSDTSVTPDLQTKAVELIDQLTAGLKAVAPQMADVTLAAIRFQGVVNLIGDIATIGLCGVVFYAAMKVGLKAKAAPEKAGWPFHVLMASTVVAVGSLVVAGFNIGLLCNSSLWAAIIDPRLALALRVINKLM
jgi:hypothetical protein